MEAAVAAEEGGVGEDAAPRLADEGRAEEARWLVRREAEEDLHDDVLVQLRRRRSHGVLVVAGSVRVWVATGLGKGNNSLSRKNSDD